MAAVTRYPISRAASLWLPGYLGWFAVGMGFALWQVARGSGRLGHSALDTLSRSPARSGRSRPSCS